MGKIAVLHTTVATVGPLGNMLREACPGVEIQNFMDDSILPMLREDMSTIPYAYEKLLSFAKYAEKQGVQLVFLACSSVGDFQQIADKELSIPFVRIDDAVTDKAVTMGEKIAVLATLPTTLGPSGDLIKRKGTENTVVTPVLVEGAFEALSNGDRAEHDKRILEAVKKALDTADIVYLAQASMAEAVKSLDEAQLARVLTSTGPGVAAAAALYKKLNS